MKLAHQEQIEAEVICSSVFDVGFYHVICINISNYRNGRISSICSKISFPCNGYYIPMAFKSQPFSSSVQKTGLTSLFILMLVENKNSGLLIDFRLNEAVVTHRNNIRKLKECVDPK